MVTYNLSLTKFDKIMKAQINMLMLCTIASFCKAQCTINCTDNIGRRQGHWIDNTPKSLDVINATSRYAN